MNALGAIFGGRTPDGQVVSVQRREALSPPALGYG
eukprot:CAMPEP_0113593458 /NCGR_PEP_ID=MMETSP0015_2-20120614/38450_1 /TAXON_ID=2838 /ORGANISM="Odontella" /LENGTH=34 /DNA_ID=CAMNT_0000500181 /DNA_START=86 /DNA_END=187 /DNA_ORIENTATION=+ /assembly_acc=CAM_ASM_000160